MKRITEVLVVVLILMGVVLSGCGKKKEQTKEKIKKY